jgi:hypothetical protein
VSDVLQQATGGCYCGRVRYRASGVSRQVTECHCSQCRKQAGHRYAGTGAKTSDIEIDGAANITWFRASPHAERGFCSTGGSHLFWKQSTRDYTGILAASFDKPSGYEWQSTSSLTTEVITTKSPMACRDSPATISHCRQSRCDHLGPGSAHNASIRPASGTGSNSESTPRSQLRAAAVLSAMPMSVAITCPLGASRSWPWQASSTSRGSCSVG